MKLLSYSAQRSKDRLFKTLLKCSNSKASSRIFVNFFINCNFKPECSVKQHNIRGGDLYHTGLWQNLM